MTNVKQIQPAHADHISGYDWTNRKGFNAIEDMLKNELVVAQRKYDGERILIHFDGDNLYMTSRRKSKKNNGNYTEVQQNFPQFKRNIGLGYTVLDGELFADIPDGKGGYKNDWSTIVGIIHSLPERAIELQKNPDIHVRYAAFDCLFFDGQDLRDESYFERMKYLVRALILIGNPQFFQVKSKYVPNKEALYEIRDEHINLGEEGIVVKSMHRKYYDEGAYIKAKRFETKDIVVYDFDYGHGKYANTVGALKCGYYDSQTDSIVHVTDVNCGTDKDRDEWRDGLLDGSRKYGVIEVKCQQVTKNSLRHPVYMRYRQDKSYKMCTKDTVFEDKE